jgi:hypothetical protein
MSTVNNGPQIVRSGLVLDLDAGNGKSYSTNRFQSLGSGTVTENVTFPLQGTGTFQRVASGTVIGGYTVRPNDVVYSYALGVLGCHYHGNSAPIVAGTYATFSFDYLVTGATTYPITNYLANFEGVASGNTTAPNSLQNVWQRRSFTSAIISTSGNMNMYLYPGACGSARLADSGTIYYRNPKVEITNVDTGNSTFNSTNNIGLWYDLSGNANNGTLTNGPTSNVSNKGNILFDGANDYVSIPDINFTAATIDIWVYINAYDVGGSVFVYQSSSGFEVWSDLNGLIRYNKNPNAGLTSGPGFTLNSWNNIVATSDGTINKLYLNNVNIGSTNGVIFDNTAGDIRISGYGSYMVNGKCAMLKMYNRALSVTEITQNYEATKTRFGL